MSTTGIDSLIEQVTQEDLKNTQNLFEVRHLNEIKVDSAWVAANNLLGNRFLCRGGALLLAAPTGVGKSSFSLQAMIQWSLGRPHFGIRSQGKLKILMIQAENDDGDLVDMREGVFRGLNLSESEKTEACLNILIVMITTETGVGFIEVVRQLVEQHQPDLLWIDPLFSYLGESVSEQKAMSLFLRNGLNPVLQQYRCGLVLVHHTNKPARGMEKGDWKAGDFAYLGSGSAELANWARAVIAIRSIGSYNVFEVVLGKRGQRADIVNEAGEAIFQFYIKHGKTGICWEPAEIEETTASSKPHKTAEDILTLIPTHKDISQAILWRDADKQGIGDKRARQFVRELLAEEKIHEWKTKRAGTNAAKSYARFPQPEPKLL